MVEYELPQERRPALETVQQGLTVVNHPVVAGLLQLASGMLAVLNDRRQVVAINKELLGYLGIEDFTETLGLRPGEVFECNHAHEGADGCGTTPFCSSCGAALAIVISQKTEKPVTRQCALEVKRGHRVTDLFLQVQSVPVRVAQEQFLVLFVQDITAQQKWAAMEQVFFHDMNNILAGVVSVSSLLLSESDLNNREMVEQLSIGSRRISQELSIQRCLLESDTRAYRPIWADVSVQQIMTELTGTFETHPVAKQKRLTVKTDAPDVLINTDFSLLFRVLNNMLINAFEATPPEGEVVVWFVEKDDAVEFRVHNAGVIPDHIQQRMFQRNISTKGGLGRGVGTYSMKLFGEEILGGQVDFISDASSGTTFTFSVKKGGVPLPATPPQTQSESSAF